MKTVLLSLYLVIGLFIQTGCSCGIYGGETYVSSEASREVSPRLLAEFAQDAEFRKTSESTFRRGSVYMTQNPNFQDIRIGGSYCSMPNELLFSSPEEVKSEVSKAQTEALNWFNSRGVRLQLADESNETN
jgi:hypothetical protein